MSTFGNKLCKFFLKKLRLLSYGIQTYIVSTTLFTLLINSSFNGIANSLAWGWVLGAHLNSKNFF